MTSVASIILLVNWIFFTHSLEVKSLRECQNPIKSHRYSFGLQESFKKLGFAQKENSWQVFKKRQFSPDVNGLAHYLSYATLVTDVPIFGADEFKFLCKVIFDGFCSNWFLLVSAQPQNSQSFNQKKDIVVTFIKICLPNISSSFD